MPPAGALAATITFGALGAFGVFGAACGAREAPASPAASARVHPWPMFRGDPAHGGDRGALATPAWLVAWTVELGARIDASPLVLDDGVVVATRTGVVARLDAATGDEQARAALGGDIWATPAAVGDVLVVARRDGGRGELVGLGVDDLEVRWRRDLPSGTLGAATAIDGVVWLCSGATLVAVAPADGGDRGRWPLGDRCYGAPAARGDAVVIATRDGRVRALHAGAEVWRAETSDGADNDTAPVIAGDRVLVGSNDTYLYAFGPGGDRLWRAGGDGLVVTAPLVTGDTVVMGDDGDLVRALSLADGHELWRGKVGGDVASSPVRVGDLVIHGAHDHLVHAWAVADGTPRPPIDGGAKLFASPAVTADGAVVLATQGGRVLAIR